MKLFDGGIILIIFIVACVAGASTVMVFKLSDDNAIEEICEEVAEHALDLPEGSIDLSPSTPE